MIELAKIGCVTGGCSWEYSDYCWSNDGVLSGKDTDTDHWIDCETTYSVWVWDIGSCASAETTAATNVGQQCTGVQARYQNGITIMNKWVTFQGDYLKWGQGNCTNLLGPNVAT